MKKSRNILPAVLVFSLIALYGCSNQPVSVSDNGREPAIQPDYVNVTIPPEIAPLNFVIDEAGKSFIVSASSTNGSSLIIKTSDGKVRFPQRSWKKLLKNAAGGRISIGIESSGPGNKAEKFKAFDINIAQEKADPWLCYRLLYPGYETYSELEIIQRNITSFEEKPVVENRLLQNNCINCHSFRQNDPQKFMIHIRGQLGGTYFVNGRDVTRKELKTSDMKYGAVYPAWSPDGRFVAYSSNNIVQTFHAAPGENIEVVDISSTLVLYDVEKNEMSQLTDRDTTKFMDTFPEWSPDGKFLYFCRAAQFREGSDFKNIKYDLVRKPFDALSKTFGDAELVFNAREINKSVSFPRISPDGRFLVFTLHDYGNFSIWHHEADLYLMDLATGKTSKMNLNSDETESWHCWSSNSRWLVFSSKRLDGLTARPYFAYIDENGAASKPFVLPQKDPALYGELVKTFNRPEFIKGEIPVNPSTFEIASKRDPLKATAGK